METGDAGFPDFMDNIMFRADGSGMATNTMTMFTVGCLYFRMSLRQLILQCPD